MARPDVGASGSAVADVSNVRQWPSKRSAVAGSNRSALYSRLARKPVSVSVTVKVRSNFAVTLSSSIGFMTRPGASKAGSGAFCSTSIAWKSGGRLGSR